MTKEQILRKAIKKAIKNGYINLALKIGSWDYDAGSIFYYDTRRKGSSLIVREGIREILFDHQFAKAFWENDGDKFPYDDRPWEEQPAWQYHLQQMVLEEDPVKYLEKFI
jgi:hypothetical protein